MGGTKRRDIVGDVENSGLAVRSWFTYIDSNKWLQMAIDSVDDDIDNEW